MARKPKPTLSELRRAVVMAAAEYAAAVGRAQFTDGVRGTKPHDEALWERSRSLWQDADETRELFLSALRRFERGVRAAPAPDCRAAVRAALREVRQEVAYGRSVAAKLQIDVRDACAVFDACLGLLDAKLGETGKVR